MPLVMVIVPKEAVEQDSYLCRTISRFGRTPDEDRQALLAMVKYDTYAVTVTTTSTSTST